MSHQERVARANFATAVLAERGRTAHHPVVMAGPLQLFRNELRLIHELSTARTKVDLVQPDNVRSTCRQQGSCNLPESGAHARSISIVVGTEAAANVEDGGREPDFFAWA